MFDTQGNTAADNSEIGSIITELDLDSITSQIDEPVETPAQPGITPPAEVNETVRQMQDAPLEEHINQVLPPPSSRTEDPSETEIQSPPEDNARQTTPDNSTETPDPQDSPADPASGGAESVYASFAQAIFEEGVLSEFDQKEFMELAKELNSPAKALIELNKRTIQHHVNNEISAYPEEIQQLVKNYQQGVALKDLLDIQETQTQINNITDQMLQDDKTLRRNIILKDLTENRGFSQEEADEEYRLYEESAIDDKRAIQARDRIAKANEALIKSKAEEAQTARDNRQKAIEDSRNDLKDKVEAANEFIPGIELTKRDKSLVFNALTKPVARDTNGREVNEIMMLRAKNPVHFDTMVAYLYTKGVFNVDDKGNPAPKVDGLFKGQTSQTITNLEQQLNTFGNQFREQGSSVQVEDEPLKSGDHLISQINFK